MYKNLGKDDAEKTANLEKIKNWVGNWTLKRKKELTENVSKYQKIIFVLIFLNTRALLRP